MSLPLIKEKRMRLLSRNIAALALACALVTSAIADAKTVAPSAPHNAIIFYQDGNGNLVASLTATTPDFLTCLQAVQTHIAFINSQPGWFYYGHWPCLPVATPRPPIDFL
jgi:hypothetical protein